MDPARALFVLGESLPQQEVTLEGQARLLLLREHLLEQSAALSDPALPHLLDLLLAEAQLHIALQLTHLFADFLPINLAFHEYVGHDLF